VGEVEKRSMNARFETHCIRLTILQKGMIKVTSDGFISEGILTYEELNHRLAGLNREGWTLMSSVDRTSPRIQYPAMDLFFRKEVSGMAGRSTPQPENGRLKQDQPA